MNTALSSTEKRALKNARRVAVWTIVVSLVITASIGIYVLVTGSGDETQSKIMITTLAIAGFSVLALCHLAIMGRDLRAVGWAGIGTSAIALASSIWMIWWTWDGPSYTPSDLYMTITKTLALSALIAVSLAQTNLMLLLSDAPRQWIRVSLNVHLVLIALVVAMIAPSILTEGQFPPSSISDVYFRVFGVVLILDALATIALPVSTLVLRGHQAADTPEAVTPAKDALTVTLSGVNARWIQSQAKASGKSADAVVTTLIAAARKG